MDSQHLKDFKKVWTNTCHTMWVEILALRNLEAYLKGNYAKILKGVDLTDIIHAPESRGHIEGVDKDYFLNDIETYIQFNVTTLRIVLLSAAFESYFLAFWNDYIRKRPKYFSANSRTKEGNRIYGRVMSTRGLAEKVQKFSEVTGAKMAEIQPLLPVLREVYYLRNIIAHRAGFCDADAKSVAFIIQPTEGKRITISPEMLVKKLADPCIRIAVLLDKKITPQPTSKK